MDERKTKERYGGATSLYKIKHSNSACRGKKKRSSFPMVREAETWE
jgi:hypothetical protein